MYGIIVANPIHDGSDKKYIMGSNDDFFSQSLTVYDL